MNVRVLFFGATAEATGERELTLQVPEGDLGAIKNHLLAAYPRLADHKLLVSLNQEYCDSKSKLTVSEGDEIAIFTHVSGG